MSTARPDAIARMRMRAQGLWGSHATTPEEVVARLLAMQAQEHGYARWSVAQRMRDPVPSRVVDDAFDEGRILRTHVLRPTWHYVTPHDLRWLLGESGPRVDARSSRRYADLELDAKTRTRAIDLIAAAVEDGPRTKKQLAEVLGRSRISVEGQRMVHLLLHAELNRVICSGPMRGKAHTYAAFESRVEPARDGPEGDAALASMARRYFSSRGAATLDDFVWWSGLSVADARRALAMVDAELDTWVVDDRTYLLAQPSSAPGRGPADKADLVQCFDEVIISYRQSRDVLHRPDVRFAVPLHVDGFTHVALLDGRLLGHWRVVPRRGSVDVELRPQTRLTERQSRAFDRAVERYRMFAGDPR